MNRTRAGLVATFALLAASVFQASENKAESAALKTNSRTAVPVGDYDPFVYRPTETFVAVPPPSMPKRKGPLMQFYKAKLVPATPRLRYESDDVTHFDYRAVVRAEYGNHAFEVCVPPIIQCDLSNRKRDGIAISSNGKGPKFGLESDNIRRAKEEYTADILRSMLNWRRMVALRGYAY